MCNFCRLSELGYSYCILMYVERGARHSISKMLSIGCICLRIFTNCNFHNISSLIVLYNDWFFLEMVRFSRYINNTLFNIYLFFYTGYLFIQIISKFAIVATVSSSYIRVNLDHPTTGLVVVLDLIRILVLSFLHQ